MGEALPGLVGHVALQHELLMNYFSYPRREEAKLRELRKDLADAKLVIRTCKAERDYWKDQTKQLQQHQGIERMLSVAVTHAAQPKEPDEEESDPRIYTESQMQSRLNELKSVIVDMEENCKKLREERARLNAEIERLQREVGDLRSELARLRAELQELQHELGAVRAENAALKDRVRQLEAHVEEVQGRLKSKERRLSTVVQSLERPTSGRSKAGSETASAVQPIATTVVVKSRPGSPSKRTMSRQPDPTTAILDRIRRFLPHKLAVNPQTSSASAPQANQRQRSRPESQVAALELDRSQPRSPSSASRSQPSPGQCVRTGDDSFRLKAEELKRRIFLDVLAYERRRQEELWKQEEEELAAKFVVSQGGDTLVRLLRSIEDGELRKALFRAVKPYSKRSLLSPLEVVCSYCRRKTKQDDMSSCSVDGTAQMVSLWSLPGDFQLARAIEKQTSLPDLQQPSQGVPLKGQSCSTKPAVTPGDSSGRAWRTLDEASGDAPISVQPLQGRAGSSAWVGLPATTEERKAALADLFPATGRAKKLVALPRPAASVARRDASTLQRQNAPRPTSSTVARGRPQSAPGSGLTVCDRRPLSAARTVARC
eukprot:TRINITY_DN28849_c0_g1_i2.p1 TRINITY_DN28849_c0_g1~~TRINITY_DN28849_c0_g1_i2.p1  ORF type:complete len:601 (+),score=102.83 TRINITY_DN28849_c0_g1_i2:508-2310(+)